ncbi:hypothetical protein NQZ68_027139 [Dissostichus eleginoides]|nr:hypothetical protein NQZ68_027139 [Dissostichus eleginoides]
MILGVWFNAAGQRIYFLSQRRGPPVAPGSIDNPLTGRETPIDRQCDAIQKS